MKWLLMMTALTAGIPIALAAAPPARKAFPFDYAIDDLDNGLRVITVPLPYPDLVAFYAVVRTGSRNEVEPGKSGFAHFFEHMMFRGTEKYPPDKYVEIFKKAGAAHNAYTSDDFTAYHAVFGRQDLPVIMEVEADRFQNLKYPEAAFRTEAQAVLGEYNKNASNPITKLLEVIREASFQKHTYRHTTMGFLEDIRRMPEQFEYSRAFFDRFYRPENVVLIVAGDVKRDEVLALARAHWGSWKRGGYSQQIPEEPAPSGPRQVHVDWTSQTLPWVMIAWRGPAASDEKPDMAAMDLAGQIGFSESSPLYRRLVLDEKKVDNLLTFFPDRRDPGLLYVGARVKDPADVSYVKEQILATVEELCQRPVDAARLEAVKSNLRYAFALSMDNTESVAAQLAPFIQLNPTPETVNRIYALYDSLTPEMVRSFAKRYFTEQGRTIATLSSPAGKPQEPHPAGPSIRKMLRPSQVPLVSFRLMFDTGAADDPRGKEGVAALTAAMLSRGGSRTMSYEKIVEALFPLAASVSAQVDKEMTVFSGTTHLDNLDRYYRLISSMLLEPGWDEDDFRRLKDDAINYLKVNLRGNNDEELGKEALSLFIYGPDHPYGHENTGTLASLEKLTLDDLKEFYRRHYTRAALTLGLAGAYPADFVARVEADFAELPPGAAVRREIPAPAAAPGQHLRIIQKETRSTAISLGFPIQVTRRHKDWAALWLAVSWLGQHRSSTSHLYQVMRETRGLNYGDYAYIEHFPRGMFQTIPDPNLGRSQQLFQIWIRPVEPENGHFALRIAVHELRKLIEGGLTQEDFEETRQFLDKFAPLMARTQSLQLGYALDGGYYGTGDFVGWVRSQLKSLTREQVNQAIRAHLDWKNLRIVMVAREADKLRQAILSNAPSPITYNSPKAPEVLEEDRLIEKLALSIRPEDATVVPVDELFSRK